MQARPPRVLVVDDEAMVAMALQAVIEELGCEVKIAGSVESARSELLTGLIDLVVSDIHLPGEDGKSLLAWHRQHIPETPFILITGQPETSSAALAVRDGAADYLTKPFEPEDIQRSVARAMQKRHQTPVGSAYGSPDRPHFLQGFSLAA